MRTANGPRRSSGSCFAAGTSAVGVRLPVSVSPSGIGCTGWMRRGSIYKARWQIELFFKWVKQHLKIKSFLGTTANAVMTQVWVALCVYLLVAYVKFLRRPPGRL